MDVIVKDTDVLNIIVEYLHSRKLILSCETLLKEAKLEQQHAPDTNLNLQALQSYCWAGKWDSVQKFLQPFCSLLDNFPVMKLQKMLFRQCFCESKISCFQNNDEILDFSTIQGQLMSSMSQSCDISGDELKVFFAGIQQYFDQQFEAYKYPQAVLIATRMECYNEILDLTKEVFHQRPGFNDNGSERLISMMLKASFYEMCTSYCGDRAMGEDTTYAKIAMEKNPEDIVEYRLKSCIETACLDTVSPSFYYWLRGIQNDDIFKQPFVEEDVQIIVEKMNLIEDQTADEPQENNKTEELCDIPEATKIYNKNNTPQQNYNVDDESQELERFEKEEQQLQVKEEEDIANNNNEVQQQESLHKHEPTNGQMTTMEMNNNNNNITTRSLDNAAQQSTRINEERTSRPPTAIKEETNQIIKQPSPNISARDSYNDFKMEQDVARQDRDQLLQKLQEKEKLRKLLEQKLEETNKPPTTYHHGNQPKQSSTEASYKSLDSLRPSTPTKKTTQPPPQYTRQSSVNSSVHSDVTMQQQSSPPRKKSAVHGFNYIPVEKTGDTAAIRSVSFHPSGNLYAVGTNSQTLKLCKVPSNLLASLHTLDSTYSDRVGVKWSQPFITLPKVHKGSIYSSAWNEKGDIIATCSNDKSVKLFLFDEEQGVLKTPPLDLIHHHGIVRDVAFIPDTHTGLCLASAGPSDGVIYITNCETNVPLHKIPAHKEQILSLFAWKSQMLASASQDGYVKVWDTRSMKCVHSLQFPSKTPTSVCIDAKGEHIAVGRTDAITQIYDMSAYNVPLHTFKLHENEVRSVRYHPFRSNILMSASYDHTSIVVDYQLHEYTHARLRHHHDKLIQGRWHPSGLMLATTSADQTCVLSVVQEKTS